MQLKLKRLIDDVYERAIEVMKGNATKYGFKASIAYYNQVWARDSFISFLGANAVEDEILRKCCYNTISTFAKTRSPLGQIANFFDLPKERAEFGFSGSTDSSCWYIIGLASLYYTTEDRSLLKEPLDAAIDSYKWLRYQDANNTFLIDSPEGADWMDAAIQRTGKTLYNNILFFAANRCITKLCELANKRVEHPYMIKDEVILQRLSDVFLPDKDKLKRMMNYWPRLAELLLLDERFHSEPKYYLHYISFARIDSHFDTLSNLLCILFGAADLKVSKSIISYIMERRLARPYPIRVLDPPYTIGDPGFDTNFNSILPEQHRSEPYCYHNGAIWPFVGGFYVIALIKLNIPDYLGELELLAKANKILKEKEEVGYNEWLHGIDARPLGQYGQTWSAGMFIAAYSYLKGRYPLSFLS